MSTKADIVAEKDLDHHSDRVYLDSSDRTINIELCDESEAYVCVMNSKEDGDGVALLSVKEESKLGKALLNGLENVPKENRELNSDKIPNKKIGTFSVGMSCESMITSIREIVPILEKYMINEDDLKSIESSLKSAIVTSKLERTKD